MGLPVGGATISQYYGPTNEKLDGSAFGYAHFNRGVDFAAKEGTPVQNVAPGTVIWVGDAGDGWGYSVKVMLEDGRIVSYGHLQDQSSGLQIGQKVTPGAFIGKVGNTGKSTGPHLSFDVYDRNGTPLDPSDLLGFNVAIDNRTGTSWQPRTGGGGGAGTTEWLSTLDDDSLSKIREGLRQRALQAWEAYADSGSDADYKSYQVAIADLMDFEDVFGSSSDGTSAAQRAFENALKLQDLESVIAERQFNRWLNKQQLADAAATGEATQRAQHNANLAAMQEAINTSQTPGLLPRPTDAGYIETGYQDLLKKWQEKFGVGEEPPAQVSTGVGLPGSGMGSGPVEPIGPVGGANQRDNAVADLKRTGDFPVKAPVEYPGAWGTVPFGKVIYNILAGAEGKKVPGNREWDEQVLYGTGKALGWSGRQMQDKAGDVYEGTKKQAKKWWNLATNPKKWWNGIPRHAEGTLSHPGGPALVNEKGPETVVLPDGTVQALQGGPTVMTLPPGTAVLPAGIDPREAFYFAQVRGAAGQSPKAAAELDPAAQAARAQDPQLLEKVRASILRAAAGLDAVNPPYTPMLGPGIEKDYWKDWRGLTGVPAHAPLPGQPGAPGKGAGR